jgi:predicted Rossmann fold nucleotide-binding protein DprA/Smf involved in DNA uptake
MDKETAQETALHAVMLSELPHVGDTAAGRIMALNRARGHTLATFFRLPEAVLRDDYKLRPAAIARLCRERAEHESRCRWLLDQLIATEGAVYLSTDAEYPARVRQRLDPVPAVLYTFGARAGLTAPTLAVLNSRTIGEHAVAASLAVVQAAAAQGLTLVTGGMKTSYRIAAVAGRAAAAPRAIVLDRGIFATFGARMDRDPFGFGPGRSALDAERTLVLSPFRLMDHATPRNGQRRDAMIAALADVIVAVHARAGGQIERVCLEALDRGQCVLSWYGENAGLVAAGATAIEEKDLGALARYVAR